MQPLGPRTDRPELLVLRALKLGDLLVAVPALHGIRRAHPEHRLVLATTPWLEPVVDLVDGVDALLPTPHGLDDPLDVEPGRIDIGVNLHGAGPESELLLRAIEPRVHLGHANQWHGGPPWRDGMLERQRWADVATFNGMPADPDEVWLQRPAPSEHPGAAVVHIGAFYGSRAWPADRFAEVARALAADGHEVIVTGGDTERARAVEVAERAGLRETAVGAGRLALGAFAALVADARLVVTVDTGAAHLASAFGTPSVIVFGPAPVEEWGPPPGPHIALTHAELRGGDAFGSEPDPALLAVTVDEVLDAVRQLPERAAR